MSNGSASNIFAFSLGVAAGSFIAWRLLKEKYERIAKEEIDSVKEVFSRRVSTTDDDVEVQDIVADDISEEDEYQTRLDELEYCERPGNVINTKEERVVDGKPYVISPEEFGEKDYECVSLTYYADGTLTDSSDEPIEDVDDVIGSESLSHFGEYEDDSVFVRNDEMEKDFEILYDSRRYSDVIRRGPYQSEDE